VEIAMSGFVEILPSISAGLVDEIGNGLASNNRAEYWPVPSSMLSQPQSQWTLSQWGQANLFNSSNYQTNDSNAYDSLYGNPLYNWSTAPSNDSFAIFQSSSNSPEGDVYQLTNVNTISPPSTSAFEADLLLSSLSISPGMGNLAHPINVSLNAKIVSSYFLATPGSNTVPHDAESSGLMIGFTLKYNGAGGIFKYSGFVQIDLWNSYVNYQKQYETPPISTDPAHQSAFISTTSFSTEPRLPLLPSDSSAEPETLALDVNAHVPTALASAFVNFSVSQKAYLLDPANWTITSMYVGSAVYDENSNTATDDATITSTVQLSNIHLTEDSSQTYNYSDPVTSVAAIDPNPTISFIDNTTSESGTADASVYTGSVPGIQYKYIYQSSDNVALTIPTNGNWIVGGGGGTTEITAISGNNVLVGSTGSSVLTGGTGDDTFDIPDANITGQRTWDTIVNFHPGDTAVLAGIGSKNWTYTWVSSMAATGGTGLTLNAVSNSNTGLSELVTFAGLSSNDLAHLVISPDQSTGNLTISSNSDPTAPVASNPTIDSGGVGTVIASGSGSVSANIDSSAADTIIASGSDSVSAYLANLGGSIFFINNSNVASQIIASINTIKGSFDYGLITTPGSVTAFGGAGGGTYDGGTNGQNDLIGGTGAVTLFAAGMDNMLSANGGDNNILNTASGGNDTLYAGGYTKNNLFFLGDDTESVKSAGSGAQVYFTGIDGSETIVGSTSKTASNTYIFNQSSAQGGGTYTIVNFKPGSGFINLTDSIGGVTIKSFESLSGVNSGTQIDLSNGSTVKLIGFAASSFKTTLIGGKDF
jgi:hypothetical protein